MAKVEVKCSRCGKYFGSNSVCTDGVCPAKSMYGKFPRAFPHLYVGLAGGYSAGKTYYLLSLIQNIIYPKEEILKRFFSKKGLEFQFANEQSEESFDILQSYAKSEPLFGTRQVANNKVDSFDILVKTGIGADENYRLLSLFNSSGETFENSTKEMINRHEIKEVNSFLYFIDPIHDSGFRNLLTGYKDIPRDTNIITSIDRVLQLQRMNRAYGKNPIPLAVNISKYDLLEGNLPIHSPLVSLGSLGTEVIDNNSNQIRSLLNEKSRTAEPEAIESRFSRVKYFAVSSIGHDNIRDQPDKLEPKGIYAPFFWILSELGIIRF